MKEVKGGDDAPPKVILSGGNAINDTFVNERLAIDGIGDARKRPENEVELEIPHGSVVHSAKTLFAVVDCNDSLHEKLSNPSEFAKWVRDKIKVKATE